MVSYNSAHLAPETIMGQTTHGESITSLCVFLSVTDTSVHNAHVALFLICERSLYLLLEYDSKSKLSVKDCRPGPL